MKFNDKIYYSSDNDEVIDFKQKTIKIDENYKYIHKNWFYRFWSWFTYRFFATPFAFITFKIFKKVKFHNAKILKQQKSGYFVYANHTNQFCDGFCPGLICFPKKPYIIVDSSNISIPIIGKFNQMWGALPLPSNIGATKNFYHAIEHILKRNNPIVIYPEAHLWPYHTKIRNFSSASFRYPIKFDKPMFIFTTVYKKKKHGKKPKLEIFIDGPFYHNKTLPEKVSQNNLRNVAYEKMNERVTLSDYEFIKYIKRSNHD